MKLAFSETAYQVVETRAVNIYLYIASFGEVLAGCPNSICEKSQPRSFSRETKDGFPLDCHGEYTVIKYLTG